MDKNELSKLEALKLIPLVVDNEARDEELEAFLQYIADHDDVRRKYESMQKIKSLMALRCPTANAPASLKKNIKNYIADAGSHQPEKQAIYSIDKVRDSKGTSKTVRKNAQSRSARPNKNYKSWIYAAAAGILIIVAAWGFYYFFPSSPKNSSIYNIEEYALAHFKNHEGQFIPPTITTSSTNAAESQLAKEYDMFLKIPGLRDANFKGVVYSEFVPGFKAPMLEYHIPSEDEYVYIFTFKLDSLKAFGHLFRDADAVKACNQPEDFHIRNINGKHVVSWKWDDVWYAAISNHQGNTLASLVKPLNYQPED